LRVAEIYVERPRGGTRSKAGGIRRKERTANAAKTQCQKEIVKRIDISKTERRVSMSPCLRAFPKLSTGRRKLVTRGREPTRELSARKLAGTADSMERIKGGPRERPGNAANQLSRISPYIHLPRGRIHMKCGRKSTPIHGKHHNGTYPYLNRNVSLKDPDLAGLKILDLANAATSMTSEKPR